MSPTRFAACLPVLPWVLVAFVSLNALAGSGQCEARSSAHRVTALELYTSEGCNSCPPADQWVSALPGLGFIADRVVPLAFHVDYWDQLGWPDRLAKAQFSARQRAQALRNRSAIVYTPQLLLNGADYRFADRRFGERVNELNQLPPGATLLLRQRQSSAAVEVKVEMRLLQADGGLSQTFIALTENALESAINAGENRGKLLHHDFVVRELSGPLPKDASGRVNWEGTVGLRAEWKRADLSLVAFVQDERTGEILQALHTPLCTGQ